MASPRSDQTFAELLNLLRAMERLMRRVRVDLIDHLRDQQDSLDAFDQTVLLALEDNALADVVFGYFAALNEEQLAEVGSVLAEHGLADDSPDLQLKLAVWNVAMRRSAYSDTGAEVIHRTEGGMHRLRPVERLKSAKPALAVANTVLESVGKALPPAGALAEIKGSYENVIDILRAGTRGAKRLWARLPFWRRRGRTEMPPDEAPPVPLRA